MFRVQACMENGRRVEVRPAAPVPVWEGGWVEDEDVAVLTALEALQRGEEHVAVEHDGVEWLHIGPGGVVGEARWAGLLTRVGAETLVGVLTNQVAWRLGVR